MCALSAKENIFTFKKLVFPKALHCTIVPDSTVSHKVENIYVCDFVSFAKSCKYEANMVLSPSH